jgi:archaellum component FlaC
MANKVVENKILKLSIDDETFKKGLNNTLNSLKGLQKSFDSIKTDSLTKVGTVASTIGDKFQGLLSRIPIVGKASDAILNIGSSADKAMSKLVPLGGFSISMVR